MKYEDLQELVALSSELMDGNPTHGIAHLHHLLDFLDAKFASPNDPRFSLALQFHEGLTTHPTYLLMWGTVQIIACHHPSGFLMPLQIVSDPEVNRE